MWHHHNHTFAALTGILDQLLVLNIDDASAPYAQAYFATRGWPRDIVVDGDDLLFAAGRYGIYKFDLDTFNLLVND